MVKIFFLIIKILFSLIIGDLQIFGNGDLRKINTSFEIFSLPNKNLKKVGFITFKTFKMHSWILFLRSDIQFLKSYMMTKEGN